jgi:hypothetical protein
MISLEKIFNNKKNLTIALLDGFGFFLVGCFSTSLFKELFTFP